MKIFCCYTPAHEVLFRDYFCPSLPAGFDVVSTKLAISGSGDYLSPEFLECIREKVALIRESIERNAGEIVVGSDVDIIILADLVPMLEHLAGAPETMWFQRESPRMPDVNTGFIIIRCGSQAGEFFKRIANALEEKPDWNEQRAVNDLLLNGDTPKWAYLPPIFYARTHGWPPPKDAVLYHANYTKGPDGVGQKIDQFKEIQFLRRRGAPARAWSILRRIPALIWRRLFQTD